LGVLLNVLLLYLIRRYSNAYLGNYKYLLAIFASYDVFLSVLHGLLNPFVMVIGNTFGAALYASWQNHELCSLYFACFSLPFSLMNIHFLYRYWSVAKYLKKESRQQIKIQSFSAQTILETPICSQALHLSRSARHHVVWPYERFFCAYAIRTNVDDVALDEIKSVFFETHTASVYDGWLVMDHWRNGQLNVPVVYVIIVTMFIIFGSLTLAICLASLTYREILKATTLSHKLISIQYTLLIAVCAQTFVPVCCVYIPYFLIIMCPFLSLPGFGLVNNFSYLVSVFPGWDAVVIIILIRDYRQGLMKLAGFGKKKKISIHLILKWKKSAILNLVTGITLNSLLILLIKRYSSAYLGNYKYLLGIFALFDNYLCTLHGLLNPVSNSRGRISCEKYARRSSVCAVAESCRPLHSQWKNNCDSGANANLSLIFHSSILNNEYSFSLPLLEHRAVNIFEIPIMFAKTHFAAQLAWLCSHNATSSVPLAFIRVPRGLIGLKIAVE
ncbi:hypothetical protein PRIPAC_80903, partial [Pristionchus pacificus]|uniref:G protein-coupled receptor n=1 Tax=Pristionchus pacificus TaxID=54126 RepID=A0A2A6CLB2_PRIPA